MKSAVPPLLWLFVPIAIIVMQICVEIFVPMPYLVAMHSEGGPIEVLQFVVMIMAVLLSGYLFVKAEDRFLKLWCGLLLLGSFYIAGEEMSWGQQLFFWSTPDFWSHVNDQDETNLHNTSSWLDQKPRALLFIGMVFGGLVVPALRRWKPQWVPVKFSALYPKDYMVPTALGVLLPYLSQESVHYWTGIGLFERVSEVQELYMYYFILLYVLGLEPLVIPKKNL